MFWESLLREILLQFKITFKKYTYSCDGKTEFSAVKYVDLVL